MIGHLLVLVTDLGDSLLLGVFAAIGAVGLSQSGARREAALLLLAFFSTATAIALLKLACMGCHTAFPWLAMRSPSGHAAIACATFGMAALIIARRQKTWYWRWAWPSLALALVAAIALSRVVLRMHTPGEVLLGLSVGAVALAVGALMIRPAPETPLPDWRFGLLLLAALVLLHGMRLPAERAIRQVASLITLSVSFCTG